MRRQETAHRQNTTQYDLFAEPVRDGTAPAPEWLTLPTETRHALTTLMVRLILEHTHEGARPEETRHDD
jgi:hypothetical protein